MEIGQQSYSVFNVSIVDSPGVLVAVAALPPDDILCMPMLRGSSTGTRPSIGGSANNCLD